MLLAAAAPTDTASLYEEADSGATQKREIDQRQRAEARLLLEEKIERFKRSRMMFHRFAGVSPSLTRSVLAFL